MISVFFLGVLVGIVALALVLQFGPDAWFSASDRDSEWDEVSENTAKYPIIPNTIATVERIELESVSPNACQMLTQGSDIPVPTSIRLPEYVNPLTDRLLLDPRRPVS